jgi:O-acetyl-ADP-ribose deacetylase (regulator of RNase III)
MPLQIVRHDITKMRVDAIVNTTNEKMVGYSGVDLAIHTAAGAEFDAECEKLAPLGLGEAKISKAYRLPCKYVIHTAGPVWQGGLNGESILLRSCYVESMKLAIKHKCQSIAFPLISSGAYGYPKDQVLRSAIQIVTEFLFDHELTVYICVFDRDSYSFSQKLFADIKEFIDDEYAEEECEERDEPFESNFKRRFRGYRRMEACSEAPVPQPMMAECQQGAVKGKTLREYLKHMDKSFSEMLFDLIDKSGMTDVECYKKANVDKRTFSKIKSNKNYKPSKQTAIAFAISLRLDLEQTQALLATVGFTLSRSSVFDKIIRYFIQNENYDIFEINEALFEFDQVLLGNVTEKI